MIWALNKINKDQGKTVRISEKSLRVNSCVYYHATGVLYNNSEIIPYNNSKKVYGFNIIFLNFQYSYKFSKRL